MNKTDRNQTWGRWDNMRRWLEGFFWEILLQSELVWEGQSFQSCSSELCYLEDNEHKELYWLCRNNYAGSEPAGERGTRGSCLLPALAICSAELGPGPLRQPGPPLWSCCRLAAGIAPWLGWTSSSHPTNTWPCWLCYWENSLGLQMAFIRVLWMQNNIWFGKACCGACTLLWKKHLKILLYPCTFDTTSCARPCAHILLQEEQRLGVVTQWCSLRVWWWKHTWKMGFCTR